MGQTKLGIKLTHCPLSGSLKVNRQIVRARFASKEALPEKSLEPRSNGGSPVDAANKFARY
jgi:hypothetical protein